MTEQELVQILTEHVTSHARDPALMSAFVARNRGFVDLISSLKDRVSAPPKIITLPDPREITCLQVAIFDNWPTGVRQKSKPLRYGISVEAWLCPAEEVKFATGKWCARWIGDLRTADQILERAASFAKLRNRPDAQYECLLQVLAEEYPDDLFAMLEIKGGEIGTLFPSCHVLRLRMTHTPHGIAVGEASLILPTGSIELPSWSRTTSAGKPLGGGKPRRNDKGRLIGLPVLQCRLGRDPLFSKWKT